MKAGKYITRNCALRTGLARLRERSWLGVRVALLLYALIVSFAPTAW